MIRALAALFLLLVASGVAGAQPIALPAAPRAALVEHPGAQLPLDTVLRDELGQPVPLRTFFHAGQPVLLVPGYYHCTELCGLLMHRLLEALRGTGLARSDWRIVGVSIAPDDGPADAQRRRALDLAYAAFLDGARTAEPPRLDLLTGDAAATARIARTVGFAYERGTAREAGRTTSSYAHPATVIVVTPDGRVARYFNGLDIDASQLRSALKQASGGGIGGLSDRIAVFCSHFDPLVGRYSSLVMDAMRVAALLGVAALAAFAWRHRPAGGRA